MDRGEARGETGVDDGGTSWAVRGWSAPSACASVSSGEFLGVLGTEPPSRLCLGCQIAPLPYLQRIPHILHNTGYFLILKAVPSQVTKGQRSKMIICELELFLHMCCWNLAF